MGWRQNALQDTTVLHVWDFNVSPVVGCVVATLQWWGTDWKTHVSMLVVVGIGLFCSPLSSIHPSIHPTIPLRFELMSPLGMAAHWMGFAGSPRPIQRPIRTKFYPHTSCLALLISVWTAGQRSHLHYRQRALLLSSQSTRERLLPGWDHFQRNNQDTHVPPLL